MVALMVIALALWCVPVIVLHAKNVYFQPVGYGIIGLVALMVTGVA